MEGWMSVEPADDGFTMEVFRGDGLTIKATVQVAADGRPLCCRLVLHRTQGQIDRDLLHTLGLATLLRRAASAAAAPVGRMPLDKSPGLSNEFLKQVAVAYRQAPKDRENTATAVARLGRERVEQGYKDAPLPTARRWIQAARERGFLKRTVKGRKGGKFPALSQRSRRAG
jgi:hypothetical protein